MASDLIWRSPGDAIVQGWVSTPNVRGTFDIWICTQTTVLCAWKSINANVPGSDDGAWELFKDKSHLDIILWSLTYNCKLITVGQTLYVTVTTLARLPQGIAITTLESTVLGFVLCTIATSACWWHKPNDVEIGYTFELQTTMEVILSNAGAEADGAYRENPLDFVCDDLWAGYYRPLAVLRQHSTSMRVFPDKHKYKSCHLSNYQSRRLEERTL